jgi:lysozyme
MVYNLSARGLDLIKKHEGLRLDAYRDIASVWTIGYGHTKTAKPGLKITEPEAEKLLRDDLADAEKAVNQAVKVTLKQGQYDALVSFTFNLGAGALQRSSLLKFLNGGDALSGAMTIPQWCKATVQGNLIPVLGLLRRRAEELQLFLS